MNPIDPRAKSAQNQAVLYLAHKNDPQPKASQRPTAADPLMAYLRAEKKLRSKPKKRRIPTAQSEPVAPNLKITITYSYSTDQQYGYWISHVLDDLSVSLDKSLRRHHSAYSISQFNPGCVVIDVYGAGRTEVCPILDCFEKHVKKNNHKMLVNLQGGAA